MKVSAHFILLKETLRIDSHAISNKEEHTIIPSNRYFFKILGLSSSQDIKNVKIWDFNTNLIIRNKSKY